MRKDINIQGLDSVNAVNGHGDGTVFRGKRVKEVDTFIKVLAHPVHTDQKEEQSTIVYLRESKKLKHLNQIPNIHVVKIINIGLTEKDLFPFIESEWIQGPDLDELLTFSNNTIFKLDEVNQLLSQMADALAHCHSALIKHGRINSCNIRKNADTGMYVLLNFAWILLIEEQRKAEVANVKAPEYLAPEQLNGELLFESDIYSLGVILFQVLTGSMPEKIAATGDSDAVPVSSIGQQIKERRKENLPLNWTDSEKTEEMNIPVWISNLVAICLQDDPGKRYSNGIKLQEAIKTNPLKGKKPLLTDSKDKPHKETEPKAVIVSINPVTDLEADKALPDKESEQKEAIVPVIPVPDLEAKEAEIKRLKSLIIQKDGQLDVYKYQTADYNPDLKKFSVSKPVLFTVLALMAALAAFATYAYFFRKPNPRELIATYSDADTSSSAAYENPVYDTTGINSESSAPIDTAALISSLPPIPEEKKDPEKDVIKEEKNKPEPVVKKTETKKKNIKPAATASTPKENTEKNIPERNTPIKSEPEKPREYVEPKPKFVRNAKYTLAVSKAYFYDEPDVRTRRPIYLSSANESEFTASKDSGGFIYVVFFNTDRQITKGWLRKVDLRQVN